MYHFLSSDIRLSCLAMGLLAMAAIILWAVAVDAMAAAVRAWLEDRRVSEALRRWARGGARGGVL